MARINWLADVLRAAGCAVREDDASWKTRGSSTFEPRGLIIHATAGGLAQSNDSAYGVLVNGREGLAGPISQVMVERGTGRWRPVCSGRSNHAKTGWAGNCEGLGNTNLIGIEYHHANTSAEPWTEPMLANYACGAAAICRQMGWGVNRIALHKEHQPGEKSDTTFDGNAFRARVQAYLNGTPQEDDVTEDDINKIAMRSAVLVQSGRWDHGFQSATGNGAQWFQSSATNSIAAVEERLRGEIRAVADRPAGSIVLTEQDKADLIAGFGAAAEVAVRRVLGAVDGATPPV